ncbi:hypothetical protein [Methylobacterium tarhaniae]|uniref:hypothetical protein n=1 Tax=Methylobacterium tarhaniae TaxID=1187852 RepID=UPI003CFD1FE7
MTFKHATARELLDRLAALDMTDPMAVNTFNIAAFLYVRPLDAPRSSPYLLIEKPEGWTLRPRAPEMHLLPDLHSRIIVAGLERGELF